MTDPKPGARTVPAPQALNRRDDLFFEELTRTNNELANLQRDLARRNADLAAAQREIHARELRYLGLSACSPVAILETDLTGRCHYANPKWSAMTGLGSTDSLGEGWQQAVDANERASLLERWRAALAEGIEFSAECRLGLDSERTPYAHMRSRAIIDAGGHAAGSVITLEDITERKASEAALERAHEELLDASHRAGMAEIAASVLHEVGNTLNSVNVATDRIANRIARMRPSSLSQVAALLRAQAADLPAFLAHDPRGMALPQYLTALVEQLAEPQRDLLAEVETLRSSVDRIRAIVQEQEARARATGVVQTVALEAIVDAAIASAGADDGRGLRLTRLYSPLPPLAVDKPKVVSLIQALLDNACSAVRAADRPDGAVTVQIGSAPGGAARLVVTDTGGGVSPGDTVRIFQQGFHGAGLRARGLHAAALAARSLGGTLTCEVSASGSTTFTLDLPSGVAETAAP